MYGLRAAKTGRAAKLGCKLKDPIGLPGRYDLQVCLTKVLAAVWPGGDLGGDCPLLCLLVNVCSVR